MVIKYSQHRVTLTLLLSCLTLASCYAAPQEHAVPSITQVRDIHLKIHPKAKPDDYQYCKNWILSANDVTHFFQRATEISSEEMHQQYAWSPCQLNGKLAIGEQQNIRFNINAASTGVLIYTDNQVKHYGCMKDCQDIFDFGFY